MVFRLLYNKKVLGLGNISIDLFVNECIVRGQ